MHYVYRANICKCEIVKECLVGENSLIVFIMTIISLFLLASLLPQLTFTGETDWTTELINQLNNILTALSCFLSSCECGYSEWHRCKTTLQTLHGFCSKELATYLWWIPHFWWVCLDCRTLSKEVECIVWKCKSWDLTFYSLKYKTEC